LELLPEIDQFLPALAEFGIAGSADRFCPGTSIHRRSFLANRADKIQRRRLYCKLAEEIHDRKAGRFSRLVVLGLSGLVDRRSEEHEAADVLLDGRSH